MFLRSLVVTLASVCAFAANAVTFTVTNTNPSGPGSLTQAITAANQIPNSTVAFNIVGTPPFTIDVTAPLPTVTVPMTIDASTQPGYVGTTPLITLVSHLDEPVLDIETFPTKAIAPPGVRIQALSFRLWGPPAIVTNGANILRCTFERSGPPADSETSAIRFLNTSLAGVALSMFSFGTGVEILNSSHVGISTSRFDGCYRSAIAVKGSSNIAIGERPFGDDVGNIIGRSIADGQPAVSIDAASSAISVAYTEIAGAFAGIDFAGTKLVVDGTTRIHDVDAWGIRVNGGQQADLIGASIYNVGGRSTNGIVLANGGDHDIPAPALTSATVTPAGTTVTGFSNVSAVSDWIERLYVSDSCNSPGGQRRVYGVDFSGTTFSVNMPPLKPGSYITALQQRTLSNTGYPVETSSYSQCIAVTGSADGPAPVITSTDNKAGTTGAPMEITGSNFADFGRVFFGATEAWDCRGGGTRINCSAPPGTGTVDITVENPDGKRAVKPAAFTYVVPCHTWINSISGDAVTNGTPVTLSVVASGDAPMTYQWSAKNTVIAGETGPSLTVQPPQFATVYQVLVSTGCGYNADAVMSVVPCFASHIRVAQQPADVAAFVGAPVTFCTQSLDVVSSYQWYEGPQGNTTRPLPNGIGNCVKVTAGQTASVWARLSNGCTSADTRAATLTPVRRRAAGK